MKRFMQKAALLSMCPIAMVTALLTSSMVYIYQAYPTLSESTVTLVLTIPNLTVIAGLVLAPILVKKFSIKYLILIGMTLFTVGNAMCAWVDSFYLMLCFRAVSGVGSGLVVPLQNTFIASYPEEERATLLGLNNVTGALIVAPLAVISGIVATINWRYVFHLYWVNLVVILLVAIFLPKHIEQPANTAKNTGEVSENKPKLSEYSNVLFFYYFMLTGCYLCVTALASQLAPYLENLNLGGAVESGMMVGVGMIGSLVSGLTFGKFIAAVQRKALPIAFAICVVCMAMLWLAPNLAIVALAQVLTALCSSIVVMTVTFELSRTLPLSLYPTASAGINFFVFVLQFFAPIVFLALVGVVPMGSFRTVFMIYTLVQVAMLALSILLPKVLLDRE